MRRRKKQRDEHTVDMFGMPNIPKPQAATPGSMDYRAQVAALTNELMKQAPDNRYRIAARMSELCGHESSKGLLDSYTAESREGSNLPLWKVPALETACEARMLTEWLVGVLGGTVLWGADVIDAEIGRIDREMEQQRAQRKALKKMRGQIK